MASAAVTPLVTEGEFLRLPESTDKIELIDGEVIVSPSPSYWHQELLGRLVAALRTWASSQRRAITIGQAPLDIRFARNRILQPDAFVLFAQVPADHEGPIDAIPALCAEVLSSNRVHDRVTKRLIYAAAGVSEYWVVDGAAEAIERWTGPGLGDGSHLKARLTTPLLPRFSLDLRRYFSQRRAR